MERSSSSEYDQIVFNKNINRSESLIVCYILNNFGSVMYCYDNKDLEKILDAKQTIIEFGTNAEHA